MPTKLQETKKSIAIKVRIREYTKNPGVSYIFCTACQEFHSIHTKIPDVNGTIYNITGTLQQPTITPLVVRVIEKFNKSKHSADHICNGVVTEGQIRYLENCTHTLAGKSVELSFVD